MNDALVNLNDVLLAMADSLVEKQPVTFCDTIVYQDLAVKFTIGGKPPREVFYRNTLTFITKLPPPVQSKICTFRHLCTGAPATIKCHSCTIYDPKGMAFFCQECFDAHHPWHRAPHIFVAIEQDELIQHTLKISHRVAEANRCEREGEDMLASLRSEHARLEFIADDASIEDRMGVYGRRAVALEEELSRLRDRLRRDMGVEGLPAVPPHSSAALTWHGGPGMSGHSGASSGVTELSKGARTESNVSAYTSYTLDSHTTGIPSVGLSDCTWLNDNRGRPEASEVTHSSATCIQSLFRGRLVRVAVSLLMAARVVRVWSAADGRDFFYDRATELSSWTPPRLLLSTHLDDLSHIADSPSDSTRPRWACKTRGRRRRLHVITGAAEAAAVLQGFARCATARRRTVDRADMCFRQVWDAENHCFYYADMRTGQTSWSKPAVFLVRSPPTLGKKEQCALAAGGGRNEVAAVGITSRIDPRINRL